MLGGDFVRALLARVHRALRSVEFLFRCRIGGWSIGAAGDERSDDEKGSKRDQFDFHSAFSMQAACHALNVDFKHLSYSALHLQLLRTLALLYSKIGIYRFAFGMSVNAVASRNSNCRLARA